MKNVSAGQAVGLLEIFGRDDVAGFDQTWQIRSVLGKSIDHSVTERLALRIPIGIAKLIWRILHVDRHDMLARGRE